MFVRRKQHLNIISLYNVTWYQTLLPIFKWNNSIKDYIVYIIFSTDYDHHHHLIKCNLLLVIIAEQLFTCGLRTIPYSLMQFNL